jgi:hypothetical protein
MSGFKPTAMPAKLEKTIAAQHAQMEKLGYLIDKERSVPGDVKVWEKVFTAVNDQRKKLHKYKPEMLDCLKPYAGTSAEAAWLKIEDLARVYDRRKGAPWLVSGLSRHHVLAQARDLRLYKRIKAFSKDMKAERDKCAPDDLWLQWHLNNVIEALNKAAGDQELPPHKGTTSPVPVALIGGCIVDLASLYKKCTRKKPGAGAGPFAGLVVKFWQALGNERSDVAIIKDIKKARKAHPGAF